MTYPDEVRARISKVLRERGCLKACPACGSNQFELTSGPVEMREFNEGIRIDGAPITPLVLIICSACAHAQFFHAMRLGIIGANGRFI